MISYLNENPFWRAQIIQMQVSKAGDVELFTALGDQRIEFGKSDNFDVKLSKLRVFYKKVMASDWSRYSKVSVKFQDQIVCE
jgi:cell division protein FtsQ